jgi:DNA-3-methyladenine glycosylase II
MPNHQLHYLPAALTHLRRDQKLRSIIKQVGDFGPKPARSSDYFRLLCGAIISQMLSTKAAKTIQIRLWETLKPQKCIPQAILQLKVADLRAIGLSGTKASAMLDLAQRAHDGRLPLRKFPKLEDDAVVEYLTDVHGIGRWTAEMFLMFGLVRPDIWPVDDLGLRMAVRRLDGLKEMPSKKVMLKRGEVFAPYRTVASWYLWQSLKL